MTLNISISKPLRNGSDRQLTQSEIRQIRKQSTLRAYRGKQWQLRRNDGGDYSLLWATKDSGATWAVES